MLSLLIVVTLEHLRLASRMEEGIGREWTGFQSNGGIFGRRDLERSRATIRPARKPKSWPLREKRLWIELRGRRSSRARTTPTHCKRSLYCMKLSARLQTGVCTRCWTATPVCILTGRWDLIWIHISPDLLTCIHHHHDWFDPPQSRPWRRRAMGH